MSLRSPHLLLMLSALALSGCIRGYEAERAAVRKTADYVKPQTWLQAANQHETEGDLQRALYEYRLARTLSHGDSEVEIHVRRVQSKIKARTSTLLKQAERAARNGNSAAARARYLDILGLQPDHPRALAALRGQDAQRSLIALTGKRTPAGQETAYTARDGADARQTARVTAVRPTRHPLAKKGSKQDRHSSADAQSVESNLQRAEASYRAQRWDEALIFLKLAEQAGEGDEQRLDAVEQVRKQYAETLYNQGVISHRSEPQKAIDCWRYAIKFDPEDDKSRLRIRSLTGEQEL